MTLNARFNLKCALSAFDVRMLWLSELGMRDWMNMGLNCQRQKWGQWTVISEHIRFVRIFVGLLQRGNEPELSAKRGYYSQYASQISWDMWPFGMCIILKALNGFLLIQKQMTLKVYNVWKLHRPRIVARFVSWVSILHRPIVIAII